MSYETLKVNMLGTFSLTLGEKHINCDINRSKRVWLLLAYIIYNRRRTVPQNELIELLWSDDADSANPAGALKTTMHRVRATLDMLAPEAGHDMIVYKNGGYSWNPEIEISIDAEEFEALCASAPIGEADGGIDRLSRALSLYRGEFLSKLSNDTWTIPIATYFSNLYMQAFGKLLPMLYDTEHHEDAVRICREALLVDPYHELIYQHLMKNLIALDRREEAINIYDELSKLLFSNFGVVPAPESRELYREALRVVNDHVVQPGMVSDQLREQGPILGALVCDYDFFKMLYQAEARLIARSGDAVHIALVSLSAYRGKELSRKSLEYAMDNFQDHLHRGLRKGDIISRCSPSQFVVMLPGANYENSIMVCQRIIKNFNRQYPHSPAKVEYSVQPLVPHEDAAPKF